MADVTPDDVSLTTWRSLGPPTVQMTPPGDPKLPAEAALSGALTIEFPDIYALAIVTVRGAPGDDVGFWRFGFIQLGFINEDWAHYRNDSSAEGSVFVARDRPPALDQQLCRDSVAEVGLTGAIQRFPYLGPIIFYDPETPMRPGGTRGSRAFCPWARKFPPAASWSSPFSSAIRQAPIGGG